MDTAVSLSVQRRSLLLWLSLVLAGAGTAQAEDRALLVGVGTYQDGSTLLGGSRDLDSMRQVVAKLGFGPQQIRVLADRAATRQGLLGSIQSWLVDGVTAGDRVLFYFVGHGTRYTDPAGQNGCSTGLVPYDLANVVGERDLQAAFNRVPAREMLVILDSCFSGVNYRGGAAAAPARALQPRFLARSGTMACTTAVNMTPDNRISREFLIPAITHQTPVKERHALLDKFRSGDYRVIVTSRVLNEGVDVPEASIAVVLSGTATEREHIQRLGRILRKAEGKQAVLYEVITEGTSEERVSRQRRGQQWQSDAKAIADQFWENVNAPD